MNRLSAEQIQAQILGAAAAARANCVNVSFTRTYCKSTKRSVRLTDSANHENGTTADRTATTSIKFIPPEFMKAVKACYDWVEHPIISNGVKLPDTGKRPVYSVSMENNLFDIQYQEMQNRHSQMSGILTDIIEQFGGVQPDPSSARTVDGYGGWDAFAAVCMRLAGDEAVNNPDLFPYTGTADFLESFSLEFESELADPTKNMEHVSEFAKALLTDNRISAATKMFQSVIGETADAMAEAVNKIRRICPAQQFMVVDCVRKGTAENRSGERVFSLRIDATQAMAKGDTDIEILIDGKHDEYIPFKPVKSKPVFKITDTDASPVSTKKLEGLARKVVAKLFSTERNLRYKHIQWDGGAQLQCSTFAFMTERAQIIKNYVSSIPETDFPVLHAAIKSYCDITEELNEAATMSSRSKDEGVMRIFDVLDDCTANVEDLESVLT